MIVRCSGCGGALRWEPALQKLKCRHCESLYEVRDFAVPESEKDMMECNIFACTACGARLAINDVEAATFCAYCGQPTVVFERVSKMLRPTHILPFKITRKEAESAIRKSFGKGSLVPKAIKHFEVERMSGIYVPCRVYNVTYRDRQIIHVSRRNYSKDFVCKATTHFKGMVEDASLNFCNESAARLEPFDFREQQEFHEAYLSGFYADRYDEKEEATEKRVLERCRKLFNAEVINTLTESGSKSLVESKAKHTVKRADYVLVPVWFLTLRYKKRPYTMLVNGQNGKVVGSVPMLKLKSSLLFTALLTLGLMLLPKFYTWLFSRPVSDDTDITTLMIRAAIWAVPTFLLFADGIITWKRMFANVKRTSDWKMADFATDRQEDNG